NLIPPKNQSAEFRRKESNKLRKKRRQSPLGGLRDGRSGLVSYAFEHVSPSNLIVPRLLLRTPAGPKEPDQQHGRRQKSREKPHNCHWQRHGPPIGLYQLQAQNDSSNRGASPYPHRQVIRCP